MMTSYRRKDRKPNRLEKGCQNFQETAVLTHKMEGVNKAIVDHPNTKAITISKFKAIYKAHLVKDTITITIITKIKSSQGQIHP